MEVHRALAQHLAQSGVGTIFGVMGDGNVYFADSFQRGGGRYVATTNEASAVLMALGYASVSGRIGVATVTHGPGLSNTVSGLIEGAKGQIPMLLVCGDTAVVEREHSQDIAQRELVIATGAGFEQVRSPKTLLHDAATALRRAHVERRPVVLNVPVEFMWEDAGDPKVTVRHPETRGAVLESADIDNAVGIIAASRRPIILAGRGAVHARAALLRLAERTGALLATSLKAKDLFRGEPYDLGLFGTLSSPAAADLILESDCILSFGASLTRRTTSGGAFLRDKRLVQSNLEASEIGRLVQPDAGLVGDAELVANLLIRWLDEAEIAPSGFRSAETLRKAREKVPLPDPVDGQLDLRRAIAFIEGAVPPDRILVTDGGRFASEPRKALSVRDPRSYVHNWNSGAIGFGLPSAIGASFADPGRPVLLVAGDGGFMLGGVSEFSTAVRTGTDLIVVICNDGAYGAEYVIFKDRGMDPTPSRFDWPDFAAIAASMGGEGITVMTDDDLEKAGKLIAGRAGPILIDLLLDPERMPERSG